MEILASTCIGLKVTHMISCIYASFPLFEVGPLLKGPKEMSGAVLEVTPSGFTHDHQRRGK